MEKVIKSVRSNLKPKVKSYTIDNFIFKLHYRITTPLLFLLTVMVTSQELIGEHIKCMTGKNAKGEQRVPENIINRFCYVTTTFTMVKHLNVSMLEAGLIPHPGLERTDPDDEVKHHAYYQWVSFMLFGQAVLFYIPHLIWKRQEGERMKKLVAAFMYAPYAMAVPLQYENITIPNWTSVKNEMHAIQTYFKDRMIVNKYWTLSLIGCELLNLANVFLNIYLTNIFLKGEFLSLGTILVQNGYDSKVNVLDMVFPKVTKCEFFKYGPSGDIQQVDALCLMPLNILNEKSYTLLWFWFMSLLILTGCGLLWRLLTFILHSQSMRFNRLVFYMVSTVPIDRYILMSVVRKCTYFEWILLVYIAKNMDGLVFREFFDDLAKDLNPLNPRAYDYVNSTATAPLLDYDLDSDKK